VNDEIVESGDTLVIQVFLSSGENVQVRRNEDNGLGRLQYMDEDKTDQANVALYSGSGESLYSLSLLPKEFEALDGYTNYGWQVVETNSNHYRNCLAGTVSGIYSRGSTRYDYEVFAYEVGEYSTAEESSDFANAIDRTTLDADYSYEFSLFPGDYQIVLYSFTRGRLISRLSLRDITILPGVTHEVNLQ